MKKLITNQTGFNSLHQSSSFQRSSSAHKHRPSKLFSSVINKEVIPYNSVPWCTLTICEPSSSSSGLLFSLKQNLAVFSQSRSLILLSAKHSHNYIKSKKRFDDQLLVVPKLKVFALVVIILLILLNLLICVRKKQKGNVSNTKTARCACFKNKLDEIRRVDPSIPFFSARFSTPSLSAHVTKVITHHGSTINQVIIYHQLIGRYCSPFFSIVKEHLPLDVQWLWRQPATVKIQGVQKKN